MSRMSSRGCLTAAASAALFLYGCSSAPPKAAKAQRPERCAAATTTVKIAASPQVNASDSGEGRPVQVRLYQLKSDAALRAAAFEDIWQKDAAVLQGDWIAMNQQTVFPGENKTVELKPAPQASVLAAVALFRQPQGTDWFTIYELRPAASKACPPPVRLSVWLDGMQIQDGEGRAEGGGSQ
jgi:type VI secretion system protein VasD